jgi:hypothetical protein
MGIPSKHYRNNHVLCNKYHTHPKSWKQHTYELTVEQLKKIDKAFLTVAKNPEKNCHTFKTTWDESFFHKKCKYVSKYSPHPTHYPFWANMAVLDDNFGPKWKSIVEYAYFFGNAI